MEKSLNVVEKISDQLYVITETESVHCYLVIGSDKAMLFDIGYGYENIMPLVRTITDLPVMLVLSHGDPDHGLGSKWFDEVWIHPWTGESFFGMTLQRCVKKQWITG